MLYGADMDNRPGAGRFVFLLLAPSKGTPLKLCHSMSGMCKDAFNRVRQTNYQQKKEPVEKGKEGENLDRRQIAWARLNLVKEEEEEMDR